MTPGPLPKEAIRQAIANATGRGAVMDPELFRRSRLSFIIFCINLTVFVRVRRTRSHILRPEDCAAEYRLDILQLRRVPLTAVVARELWLLTPWGTWQYFRILDDRLIEIRGDGVPFPGFSDPSPCTGTSPGVPPLPTEDEKEIAFW